MGKDAVSLAWPEWRSVRLIGSGSYGVVYEAVREDNAVVSRSAVKIISVPQDASEIDSLISGGFSVDASRTQLQSIVNDFVCEIQIMENLKGVQNIVSVEDYKVIEKTSTVGWDIFIRMELLTPLKQFMSDKTLSEDDIIQLGVDLCTALEICSKMHIIHRDIKPENIFVNRFGAYKLGDFGIARSLESITSNLSQRGTVNYMAPEVFFEKRYDDSADLYSLGLVLYQLSNRNRLPFLDVDRQILTHDERISAAQRRLRGEPLPAPCSASEQLQAVIIKSCAPDPKDRFSSAAEMKEALMKAKKNAGNLPSGFNAESQPTLLSRDTALIIAMTSSRVFEITKEKIQIGRDPCCDFVVTSPEASRLHATILHDSNGFSIRDDDSLNGTWVNNRKVDSLASVILGEAAHIRIADEHLLFTHGSIAQQILSDHKVACLYCYETDELQVQGHDSFLLGRSNPWPEGTFLDTRSSHNHGEIVVGTDGCCHFVCSGQPTTNGTYLNDRLLEPGEDVVLRDNDELRIGRGIYHFRFQITNLTTGSAI